VKVSLQKDMEVTVDADAYLSDLRNEVTQLRAELALRKQEKEEATRADLLSYIRNLPDQQMGSLTNTITPEVLQAMRSLVNNVLAGIVDDKGETIGPETVTEQSGNAMAQLCMWQLVVGYNLRELEVREEMEERMEGGK
tara:strand:+ start:147 stop:563 length:417 start_codon:yes stop_codon:yes gene_type:complete